MFTPAPPDLDTFWYRNTSTDGLELIYFSFFLFSFFLLLGFSFFLFSLSEDPSTIMLSGIALGTWPWIELISDPPPPHQLTLHNVMVTLYPSQVLTFISTYHDVISIFFRKYAKRGVVLALFMNTTGDLLWYRSLVVITLYTFVFYLNRFSGYFLF